MGKIKNKVTVISLGHVDSGKSTTTGHLVYKCGGIDKRTIEKFEKEASEMGKPSFKYAWVFDKTANERERGITVEAGNVKLETDKSIITILDAPGHRDFLKNMITSATSADFALIIIPATIGEAETAMGKDGSTREHVMLAFTLGVKGVVICINKMDAVNYSEARYNEVKAEALLFTKKAGYPLERTPVIPISGWVGDNIVEPSANMPWYKGYTFQMKNVEKNAMQEYKGHTVLDYLDNLPCPARPTDKPLRIPIHDTYKISGVGTVPTGRVETGIIRPGMIVTIAPVGISSEVKSIEMHHETLEEGKPGDSIGFNIKNVAVSDLRRGYVVGDSKNDPPLDTETFEAQVIVIRDLGKATSGIRVGYTPTIDVHTAHIPCIFSKIVNKVDKRSGKPLVIDDESAQIIRLNEAAIVILTPKSPLCCESFSSYPPLGRFAVRDSRFTVAVGIIKSVTKKAAAVKGAAKGGKAAAKAPVGKATAVKGKK